MDNEIGYGYAEHIEITPEQILQKVSQQEIFQFILQEEFSFSKRYYSPLRDTDSKPGCRFQEREDGTILFVDFGDTITHRNCFKLVMDKLGISLYEAIRRIIEHFRLSTDNKDYSNIIIPSYNKEENDSVKLSCEITYVSKPYDKHDKLYWSKFLIKEEQLLSDSVFSVSSFILKTSKKRSVFHVVNRCFAIDFIDAVKIYQPNSIDYKWFTNCNENHIGNVDRLPRNDKTLLIKKSYKDYRVIENLGLNLSIVWLHNEGAIPALEILKDWVNRFEEIIIFFDNDESGVRAALKLVMILNSIREGCTRMIHLPVYINRRGYILKDPSEFIAREGRLDLIEVLKEIKLI